MIVSTKEESNIDKKLGGQIWSMSSRLMINVLIIITEDFSTDWMMLIFVRGMLELTAKKHLIPGAKYHFVLSCEASKFL